MIKAHFRIPSFSSTARLVVGIAVATFLGPIPTFSQTTSERSGKWIAYYTSPEKGINPATRDHTIRARTAENIERPWSESAVEIPPITPPAKGYTFVYAESKLVVMRGGYYYRFEQLEVFRSSDPLKWEGPPIARLAPKDPLKRLAPEIVTHAGKDYFVAYQWRDRDPRGIYLAPLVWEQ